MDNWKKEFDKKYPLDKMLPPDLITYWNANSRKELESFIEKTIKSEKIKLLSLLNVANCPNIEACQWCNERMEAIKELKNLKDE